MRILITALLLVGLSGLAASAQKIEAPPAGTPAAPETPTVPEPAASVEPQRTTYFLIDGSGSMESKIKAAEVEIGKVIATLDPKAPVSRTYFRAVTDEACWTPITIEPTGPASESKPKLQTFTKDSTPLGTVLESAILHAGSGPADIYIVTDEEETPNCGVNICTVANNYLPRAGITVRRIDAGSTASDHDRLGCIEAAQAKPVGAAAAPPLQAQEEATSTPDASAAEAAAGEEDPNAPTFDLVAWVLSALIAVWRFIEYWLWLIGLAFIAGWAIRFGYKHQRRAAAKEKQTKEVQLLRDLIRQKDESAGPRFDKLVADNKTAADNDENTLKANRLHVMTGDYWALALGLLIIAALAVVPNDGFLGFGKTSAWGILSTEFASAFAIMWVALVFFVGTTLRRLQEAKTNYEFETSDTQQIRDAQADWFQKTAFAEYEEAYQGVDQFEPAAPVDDVNVGSFRTVLQATRELALPLNKLVLRGDIREMTRETARLRTILRRTTFGPLSFERFLERALADPKRPVEGVDWAGLATVLENGEPSEIAQKFSDVAAEVSKREREQAFRRRD